METLTGWGAISGMVADADGTIWAVNDSFYGFQPTIFHIDPSQTPRGSSTRSAVTRKGRPAQKLDMEGITLDGEGGFWLASTRAGSTGIPHAIYHVRADGEIAATIPFPKELMASRDRRFGGRGHHPVGDTLWIAIQREWGDDPANHVKLVSYDLETRGMGRGALPAREGRARDRLGRPVGDHGAWRPRLHRRARQPDRRRRGDEEDLPASPCPRWCPRRSAARCRW
jgi:hypothetical protein